MRPARTSPWIGKDLSLRIALLGPAPPLRGGIVTYLAMLARELGRWCHEVFWASFRKLGEEGPGGVIHYGYKFHPELP